LSIEIIKKTKIIFSFMTKTPLYKKPKDASGKVIFPGPYYVIPRDGSSINDSTEILVVDVAAAGFRYSSSYGGGNILGPEKAAGLARADPEFLRGRLRRLEQQASIIGLALNKISKPRVPKTTGTQPNHGTFEGG
jgi:hypothetical protein